MNIFGHILPDTAILGIGPLFLEVSPNLYEKRYVFDLHLSAHTTQIKSDWFDSLTTENKDLKEKMQAWKDYYFKIRDRISMMCGEPTDSAKQHNQSAVQVWNETMELLRDFLNDHLPVIDGDQKTAVTLKIERFSYNVNRLKELATI